MISKNWIVYLLYFDHIDDRSRIIVHSTCIGDNPIISVAGIANDDGWSMNISW